MGLLRPDRYVASATGIDPARLAEEGARAVLVDLDNTLVPRNGHVLTGEVLAWAGAVRDAGMSGCLVSNNWHEKVSGVADELGFEVVAKALKPLPFAFLRACRLLGVRPSETVVVGDQVFTDVLGGNLVGAATVLVEPLSSSDLPHTLLLRRLEALIMAGREPEPGMEAGSDGRSLPT